jgi:hypothetical protein
MSDASKVTAVFVGLVAAVVIAWLSALPVARGSDLAVVRASWRTAGIAIEECRSLTEEELAEIPAHMRRPEECVGRVADYELFIAVDGETQLVDTVAPAGLHNDRPIYVFRDLPVSPGQHSVEVRFAALIPEDYDPGDAPVEFRWSGEMSLQPGDVGLVTTDASGSRLERR